MVEEGDRVVLVLITAPDEEQGLRIARALLEERLAACVNVVRGVRSLYWWKGELCEEEEVILWIKSREALFENLERRVRQLHPYEVPEVIALPVVRGLEEYLKWVTVETTP